MFRWNVFHLKQWRPQAPRPRNSSVPSCRSSQSSGLSPKTLLVSLRLGGGAATVHLVTDHQAGERERRSNQTVRLRVLGPDVPHSPGCIYKVRNITGLYPLSASEPVGLHFSPQGLRSDKAIEIKRVFPREHVVHRPAQLVREYGQRFGFAVFVF